MTTVGTYLGLADILKRKDPNDKIAAIIEQMDKLNPILEDAITVEGNLTHGHRTTIRSGLPSATWRRFYEGVQPTKSATVQVDDTCGNLEAYSEVDKGLADMSTDVPAFRMSEAAAHMEGMAQTMATTLFYGNTNTDPEQFLGLAPRFSSLSAGNGGQIVDGGAAGGQTDCTSIWFVTWGERTCHLIYPKGTTGGFKYRDLGEDTKVNSDGSMYQVYRSHFQHTVGLSVRDWRYIARVANLDTSAIATFNTGSDTSPKIIDKMTDAYYKLYKTNGGKLAIYCNRTVAAALHKMAANKTNMALNLTEYAGKPVTTFLGHPIRVCDAITSTESVVS